MATRQEELNRIQSELTRISGQAIDIQHGNVPKTPTSQNTQGLLAKQVIPGSPTLYDPNKPAETPVISVDTLKPKQLVPQPPTTPTEDYSSVIKSISEQLAPTSQSATDTSSNLLSSIKNLLGESRGREAFGASQFEALGGPALEKRQRELTAEATRLNNEVQAQALQMEKEAGQIGASTTALNKGLSRLKRDAAIKALALNSEAAMISGSLDTARAAAERAVNIRYGDIDREIEQTTRLLELYRPFMTAEQQERAEARKLLNDERKVEIADKKKIQQDLINFAQQQGDAASASAAIRLDPNSSTFSQDVADLQSKVRIKPTAVGIDQLLTPTEAVSLGVPYGTTRAEAAARGIVPEKPATSAQQTVAGYAARIEQANPTIKSLEENIKNMGLVNFNAQIRLPSALQSSEMQQYMQAARNFINANLRRESGAVISPSEFSEARQQYLPQPGDTDQTLQLKENNRKLVYESLKRAAGPAFSSVEDLLGGKSTPVVEDKPEVMTVGDKRYVLQPNGRYIEE